MRRSAFISGKVILAGEHAVVYRKMALAASISLGVKVEVVEGVVFEKTALVNKAITVAGGDENLQVKIESELPIGSGLGSSAAVSAATIKAVREHLGKPIDNNELYLLTMQCEELAHGNPSGIDASTVVYGGLIGFVKGKPIEKLNIQKPLHFLLVDTGQPTETTKEMVDLVAQNVNKNEIIETIGNLVEQIKIALLSGEHISFLLNQNGLLLEKLGVVGVGAIQLSHELRKMGCSVKIAGAGGVATGSGMMIAIKDDLTQIKKFLDNKQINYFETVIGAQ